MRGSGGMREITPDTKYNDLCNECHILCKKYIAADNTTYHNRRTRSKEEKDNLKGNALLEKAKLEIIEQMKTLNENSYGDIVSHGAGFPNIDVKNPQLIDLSAYTHKSENRTYILVRTLLKCRTEKEFQPLFDQAITNLNGWTTAAKPVSQNRIIVSNKDWGEIALQLTKEYGVIFAVLNHANEDNIGGGYLHGASAQEENIFRRTNASFHDDFLTTKGMNAYSSNGKARINGSTGQVQLAVNPVICMYDSESTGYKEHKVEDYFPFYELRSAAPINKQRNADITELMKRICAQLNTLVQANIRHVVLGAFGCGAFYNDPKLVAYCYLAAIETFEKRNSFFECIVFAIYDPPYSEIVNYDVFKKIFNKNFGELLKRGFVLNT